jgi:hypothetical protein
MPFDINRMIFAQREYRTTPAIEDTAVKAKHPMATELEYNTFLRTEADGLTFGNYVLGLRKLDRWTWGCYVSKENSATTTMEVGQTITVFYPRFGFTSGANFIIKGLKISANSLFDELILFGPEGITFYNHLLALSFSSGDYWVNGVSSSVLSGLSGYAFTRTGEQGAMNAAGTVSYYATNVPAINGRGYHSYASVINNAPYSSEFTSPGWTVTNITVGTNAALAPDGTTTADSFTPPSATSAGKALYEYTATLTAAVYTFSVFIKKGGHRYFQLAWDGPMGYANYDLETQTVATFSGCTAYIVDCGDYWRLVQITANSDPGGNAYVFMADSLAHGYGGGSVSTTPFFAWQYQILTGAFPDGGPIIRTSAGAAVTLTASDLTVNLKPDGTAIVGDFYVEGVAENVVDTVSHKIGRIYNSSASTNQLCLQISTTSGASMLGLASATAISTLAGISVPPGARFSFIYSFVDSSNTLTLGVRCNGVTVLSAPTTGANTNVTGMNKTNELSTGNFVQELLAVKMGTITTGEMTARLSELLGG